jgi:phosphatidylglycerophosphatase A
VLIVSNQKKLKYIPKYDLSAIFNNKSAKINPPLTWYTLIANWFFVGRIPFMPGTLGSLASFPIYYLILVYATSHEMATQLFWISFIALFSLGWYAVEKFEENTATHDHKSVVIDEVLGMLLVFCLCFPQAYALAKILYKYIDIKPFYLCFGMVFIVFRYFDIRKPFFIKYIDKKMRSSFSVILDDLVAGVFTAIVIYIASAILGKFF